MCGPSYEVEYDETGTTLAEFDDGTVDSDTEFDDDSVDEDVTEAVQAGFGVYHSDTKTPSYLWIATRSGKAVSVNLHDGNVSTSVFSPEQLATNDGGTFVRLEAPQDSGLSPEALDLSDIEDDDTVDEEPVDARERLDALYEDYGVTPGSTQAEQVEALAVLVTRQIKALVSYAGAIGQPGGEAFREIGKPRKIVTLLAEAIAIAAAEEMVEMLVPA